MELSLERHGNALVAKFLGDLDLHTVPDVKRELEWEITGDPDINILIIDFNKLHFIDSTGIGLLLGRLRELEKRGGEMVFTGLNIHMRKILTIAGVLGLVKVQPTVKKALQNINGSPVGR